ncbi:divalent-cation tolerance protein CutA [Parasphingopyxis algicola]|uniref:divalent-cation tolerance protein CutA n=1 Tax=Parasphingopyxis algicola TaxID=2026624 RepID=UPI0015A0308B|nr:divalent-cation tolerance protein CutA [Parasphingopyxis algicola]QLC23578.1 divalent-cation tolerance protein CutA [Parasphingopyxis algicola]
MSDIVTVYTVFGSRDEAERIGRAMIEKRLAACVNILGPMQSIYRWEGAIEEAEEIAALFKTGEAAADALIAAIADMHSYDVPAICQWPIERSVPGYAAWVLGETGTDA